MDIQAGDLAERIYPLRDASRLAQLDTRTTRRWAVGYDYRYQGAVRHSHGVIQFRSPEARTDPALTFAEMLTLRLVRGFRRTGLSLRTIRHVADVAARDFDTATPLVSRRFRTDGRKIFLELTQAGSSADEPAPTRDERQLIEMLSGQHQFRDVVEPSLFANLDWEHDLAERWWPLGRKQSVVLNPQINSGMPSIDGHRLTTAELAAAVRAEGDGAEAERLVAEWYDLPTAVVEDAIRFEAEWYRRAA